MVSECRIPWDIMEERKKKIKNSEINTKEDVKQDELPKPRIALLRIKQRI